MQKQMASFLASRGTAVVVEDAATMLPVAESGEPQLAAPKKSAAPVSKRKPKIKAGG